MIRKTHLEMHNGVILTDIPFIAYVNRGGRETWFEFTVPNPPIHHGDPNLFSRLSFESIKEQFAKRGFTIHNIISGQCNESGYNYCYVFNHSKSHVPFATIRPSKFDKF